MRYFLSRCRYESISKVRPDNDDKRYDIMNFTAGMAVNFFAKDNNDFMRNLMMQCINRNLYRINESTLYPTVVWATDCQISNDENSVDYITFVTEISYYSMDDKYDEVNDYFKKYQQELEMKISVDCMNEISMERMFDSLKESPYAPDFVEYPLDEVLRIDFLHQLTVGTLPFHMDEKLFSNEYTDMNYSKAKKAAKRLLCGNSFLDELSRIYSKGNDSFFYGCPVHYRINAGSKEAALMMVDLLVSALFSAGRIKGSRIIDMFGFSDCDSLDRKQLKNIFELAMGNTVIVEPFYSSGRHEYTMSEMDEAIFKEYMKSYHNEILFIVLSIGDGDCIVDDFMTEIYQLNFVEINEGSGTVDQIMKMLKSTLYTPAYENRHLVSDELYASKLTKASYTLSEYIDLVYYWGNNLLRHTAYSSYLNCKFWRPAD